MVSLLWFGLVAGPLSVLVGVAAASVGFTAWGILVPLCLDGPCAAARQAHRIDWPTTDACINASISLARTGRVRNVGATVRVPVVRRRCHQQRSAGRLLPAATPSQSLLRRGAGTSRSPLHRVILSHSRQVRHIASRTIDRSSDRSAPNASTKCSNLNHCSIESIGVSVDALGMAAIS